MRNETFTINVDKVKLLTKLKENRNTHYANFEKALELYRKKVIEVLDEALEAAKTGIEYRTYFNLVKPENMVEEYDEVIGMLEMSQDMSLELTQEQYKNYVLDKWDWTSRFASNTLSYVGSSR